MPRSCCSRGGHLEGQDHQRSCLTSHQGHSKCSGLGSSVSSRPGDPTWGTLIPLGLAFELPPGCYGRIAPRSSLAMKGVDVAGGVVDADYRGEVKAILVNHGSEVLLVNSGDRIGQLMLEKKWWPQRLYHLLQGRSWFWEHRNVCEACAC